MMKIKDILYVVAALLLAGCTSDDKLTNNSTLSGEGKTPLRIEATLSSGSGTAITRAAGKYFAENDVLLAYLRHTTSGTLGNYDTTPADQAPKLVSFTVGDDEMTVVDDNTNGTSYLTVTGGLYWDDFSNSASAATDLRTSGHGLQSYYGYCYNGGTPSTELTAATGALGWTVQTNQSTALAVQQSDLLWSREQQTVEYNHAETQSGDHRTITIPYTHAMSQVTVTVIAAEGFVGNPLENTVLTLNGMNTVASLTAPTATVNSSGTSANIPMYGATEYVGDDGKYRRKFTAIVAPGTKLQETIKLLDIVNVQDNNYTLNITTDMLSEGAWRVGHEYKTDAGSYILTLPGYNYHLDVTVKKTEIQTHATLADWTTVNATGEGAIVYPNNDGDGDLVMDDSEGQGTVSVVAVDKNKFSATPASSFSLFTLQAITNAEDPNCNNASGSRTNDKYTFATVCTFQDNAGEDNDQWNNSPEIYWPSWRTMYYFRALAKFKSVSPEGVNTINSVGTYNADPEAADKGVAVSQGTVADGHDILWGASAHHHGASSREYLRGQAIPPRTGDVPIAFAHAMSKISFTLETTDDAAAVDLTGTTIAISNISTTGTISIETGEVSQNATVEEGIPATTSIDNYIVLPQTIAEAAKVTITLADGTTYRLTLKECKDETNNSVKRWAPGVHYTYTIHLEKEQITFRALIKNWDEKTGSGNANLEWD